MPNKCTKDILFIQPAYAHYRNQLFTILSKQYDIHFAFECSSSVYPGEITPGAISHTLLDHGFGISSLRLVYYLIKHRPSIVISSTSSSSRSVLSFLYAILFRKRFILWILEWRKRTHSTHTLKRLWRHLKHLTGIKIIQHSHALVVGGSAARRYALSLGKDHRDIFLGIQCTDDLMLRQNHRSLRVNCRPNKYTFLYMSRIVPRKGLDILLKAFSLLRRKRTDVFLLIGGDGPFRQYCQELAISLEIPDVSFVGPVSPHSVADLYKQADVFVLPSYHKENKYEPWGLVINEAMSMSLPIITTTAVGAAYDMVINGFNGFIVKENDAEALFRAMVKIIGLDLNRMGVNSRTLFQTKNDFVQMANGFTSAIHHAISK